MLGISCVLAMALKHYRLFMVATQRGATVPQRFGVGLPVRPAHDHRLMDVAFCPQGWRYLAILHLDALAALVIQQAAHCVLMSGLQRISWVSVLAPAHAGSFSK